MQLKQANVLPLSHQSSRFDARNLSGAKFAECILGMPYGYKRMVVHLRAVPRVFEDFWVAKLVHPVWSPLRDPNFNRSPRLRWLDGGQPMAFARCKSTGQTSLCALWQNRHDDRHTIMLSNAEALLRIKKSVLRAPNVLARREADLDLDAIAGSVSSGTVLSTAGHSQENRAIRAI